MSLDRLVGIFGLVFITALVVRVYLVRRQIGRMPVIFHHADAAHDYVHKVLFAIFIGEAVNIIVFRLQALDAYLNTTTWQSAYRYLGPIDTLDTSTVQVIGLILAFGGLTWSVVSQAQMGKEWRAGIDADNKLVVHGLYTVCRHPIYLGFMTLTLGLFLAAPTVLSMFCALLTIIILSIEARLEEEFLLARDGEPYRAYLKRTRRWLSF